MNPLERLEFYKNTYTKNEQDIYKWMKKNPNRVVKHNIDLIANEANTSKAAIIRFSKKLGYSGFAEFKFELSRYIISGTQEKNDDNLNMCSAIISLYSGYIKQINDFIDINNIKTIAKVISGSRRFKILGKNRTGFSAMQLRYRLTKIGFDCEAITDPILMGQITDSLTKDDVILIFTTQAVDSQYYEIIKEVSENNVTTIVVSCADTKLLKLPNHYVLLPSIENASNLSFLDNQAIIFVFIEILLAQLSYIIEKKQ